MQRSFSHHNWGEYLPLSSGDPHHDNHSKHGCSMSETGLAPPSFMNRQPGRAVPTYRPKKTRVVTWLVLHASGGRQYLKLDKRQLIQFYNLDVPLRDMRLLDVSLLAGAVAAGAALGPAQGAGQLIVRDNAIVMALEHVRFIIMADKAIIPLPEERDDAHAHFVSALESFLHDRLMDGSLNPVGLGLIGAAPPAGPQKEPEGGLHPYPPAPVHPNPPTPAVTAHTQYATAPSRPAMTTPFSTAAQPAQPHGGSPEGGGLNGEWGHLAGSHPGSHGSHASGMLAGYSSHAHLQAAGHAKPMWASASGGGLSAAFAAPQPWSTAGGGHPPHHPHPLHGASRASHDHLAGHGVMGGSDAPAPSVGGLCPGGLHEGGDGGQVTPSGPLSQRGSADEQPFELHCLEAGLGEVCTCLAREVDMLQAQAMPALEDLVSSSDRRNLERVRRVKTAHQRLVNRISVVRESLHRLLEDDGDMFRMCLSRTACKAPAAASQMLARASASVLAGTGHSGGPGGGGGGGGGPALSMLPENPAAEASHTSMPVSIPQGAGPHSGTHGSLAAQGGGSSDSVQAVGPTAEGAGGATAPARMESQLSGLEPSRLSTPHSQEASLSGAPDLRHASSSGGGAGHSGLAHSNSGLHGLLGLGSSPTRRTSLDLASDLLALGSASLRSPSMLALKLLHMQHVQQQQAAAVAAAAAAAAMAAQRAHTLTTIDASTGMEGMGAPAPALSAPPGLIPMSPSPGLPGGLGGGGNGGPGGGGGGPILDEDDIHDVLDVENLLEAYATMTDATRATLVSLGEYIDDTEDLVNINLDFNRNRIIRLELIITIGTFSIACYACVAGVLGENLVLPSAWTQDVNGFFMVNGTVIVACIAVFVGIFAAIKSKKLIS